MRKEPLPISYVRLPIERAWCRQRLLLVAFIPPPQSLGSRWNALWNEENTECVTRAQPLRYDDEERAARASLVVKRKQDYWWGLSRRLNR
jgi:hypothetical protein